MAKAIRSIRSEAESLAGFPVSDDIWQLLEDNEFVYDAEFSGNLAALVAEMQRIIEPSRPESPIRAFRGEPIPLIPGADQLHERSLAIGEWFAWAAGQKSEVQRFRQSNLPAGLLATDDVHHWVRGVEAKERPKKWITEESPSDDENHMARVKHEARFSGIPHSIFRWLELDADNELIGNYWPVPPKGTLGEAQSICDDLADWWRWDAYDTMLWLLTGAAPYVMAITASGRFGTNYMRGMGTYDVHSRITIDVDPTVTPEQLAKWWRDIRHRTLPSRYRPQSIKHLRLARFAASLSDDSWESHRQTWNRTDCADNPEWKYDDKRNFHRDVNDAVARLLYVQVGRP